MREFYLMLAGALWREERQRELVAWHAMHVMAAAGAKRKDGGALDLWALLGRGPVPGMVYQMPEPMSRPPTHDPDGAAPPPPTPTPAADPIRLRLDDLVARGLATRVQ